MVFWVPNKPRWKVNRMAKAKKDSYKKLIRIAVILAVLAVIFGAGHVWLTHLYENEKAAAEAAREERNASLIRQHQQATSEYQAALRSSESTAVWPTPTGIGWEVVDLSEFPLTTVTRSYTVTRSELISGGMLLLNRWHSLPADFPEDEVVSVQSVDKSIPVSGSRVKLFPTAIVAISDMLKGAADEGYENFVVQNGYRTMAEQTKLYQDREAQYASSFSGDALREKVTATVNYPGTSEYQSGLSFNIERWKKNDAEFNSPKFHTTEHSDWLLANSWRYGIVFRFPVTNYPNSAVTDKSFKTGESKSLMIYRYVGKGNAAAMHAMDFCMEEYIEYMIAHPHVAVYEDGNLRYEIIRVSGGDTSSDATVYVSSSCNVVSASTDNMGVLLVVLSY